MYNVDKMNISAAVSEMNKVITYISKLETLTGTTLTFTGAFLLELNVRRIVCGGFTIEPYNHVFTTAGIVFDNHITMAGQVTQVSIWNGTSYTTTAVGTKIPTLPNTINLCGISSGGILYIIGLFDYSTYRKDSVSWKNVWISTRNAYATIHALTVPTGPQATSTVLANLRTYATSIGKTLAIASVNNSIRFETNNQIKYTIVRLDDGIPVEFYSTNGTSFTAEKIVLSFTNAFVPDGYYFSTLDEISKFPITADINKITKFSTASILLSVLPSIKVNGQLEYIHLAPDPAAGVRYFKPTAFRLTLEPSPYALLTSKNGVFELTSLLETTSTDILAAINATGPIVAQSLSPRTLFAEEYYQYEPVFTRFLRIYATDKGRFAVPNNTIIGSDIFTLVGLQNVTVRITGLTSTMICIDTNNNRVSIPSAITNTLSPVGDSFSNALTVTSVPSGYSVLEIVILYVCNFELKTPAGVPIKPPSFCTPSMFLYYIS